MPGPFPLYLPPDARRLFQTESLLRRFAQMAQWDKDSRLLELHGSLGGLALVRALGGSLTIVEPEASVLDMVRERARVAGVTAQVTFTQVPTSPLDYPPASFHGIFTFGRVIGTPGEVARRLRPLLAPRGRLGFACVVKVGRASAPAVVEAWGKRLGEPLGLPRDALLAVEAQGYEPELAEVVGDQELDEYYRELEGVLSRSTPADAAGAKALKDELTLHRAQHGKAGVSLAFIVARRKEPGEKPPLSRDAG